MRRQGGGFGFVVMLVVLAVIFYIAMNNFKSVAPAAIEVQKHNKSREAGQEGASRSASADSWTPSAPSRPNLSTMDEKTSEHTKDVKDALSQAD